jgi:hypothetical protein
MSIASIEALYGPLPAAYKQFLSAHDRRKQYLFKAAGPKASAPRAWNLFTEEELSESVTTKGIGTASRWSAIKLPLLGAFGNPRHEELIHSPSGQLHLDRVFVGIVIGYENTEYLYLDSQDGYSVWMFHDDGTCDVEQLAASFAEFLSRAEVEPRDE